MLDYCMGDMANESDARGRVDDAAVHQRRLVLVDRRVTCRASERVDDFFSINRHLPPAVPSDG